MTERERKLLRGGTFDPLTQDEAAIKYAIDNAGSGGGGDGDNVLSATFTPTSTSTGTMNVALDEIKTAFSSGKCVIIHVPYDSDTHLGDTYYVSSIDSDRICGIAINNELLAAAVLQRVSGDNYNFQIRGGIAVDNELDADSENPVQNKVITAALENKANSVVFEFDIAVDSSGGSPVFTATARTGSTYANITAAMAANPNVLMRAYLPDNEVLIAPFNRQRSTLVSASGLVPDYSGATLTNWQVFGLNVEDNDTLVVLFNNLTTE